MVPILFVVALLCFGWIYFQHLQRRWSGAQQLPYPPGPIRKPIIGNLLDTPKEEPWRTFAQWKDSYGDMVMAQTLGTSIIILHGKSTMSDLLEKKGAEYSHRPAFTLSGELMGLNRAFPFLDYNNHYKKLRKYAHSTFSPEAVIKFQGLQQHLALGLLKDLLIHPTRFLSLSRDTTGRLVIAVTYGIPPRDIEPEFINEVEDAMRIVNAAVLPGHLVDVLPALKYLPKWLPFHRKAAADRAQIEIQFITRNISAKNQLGGGANNPSFVRDMHESMLNDEDASQFEEVVKWSAGSFYGAGAETTHVVLSAFVLAMALYPDKQRKAQEELDAVLGPGVLPKFKDRKQLPYINAIIKETLRWHVPVPLGLPRRASVSDEYKGYHIPKDAMIFPNIWAIGQDVDSPDDFVPERFLENKENIEDPSHYIFGFGRRICPGKYLAENSLYIFVSSILAMYTITRERDAKGVEHPLKYEVTTGVISHVKEFKCQVIPRSELARNVLQRL